MRKDFINAVKNKEVKSVRIMLSNELLLDPRGKTFSEMLQYAKDNLPNLFEENKPLNFEIPKDKRQWDEDFMFKMKKGLDNNFSCENLGLFEAVVMEVGKKKAEKIEKEEKYHTSQSYKESSHDQKTPKTGASKHKAPVDKKTASVITVSGATLTLIGIGIGKTLLTLAGGTIVVGGIVLLTVADKQK